MTKPAGWTAGPAGKTARVPLPQLTPVTAVVGVIAAAWAGATIGLVAHTVGSSNPGTSSAPRTVVVTSVPPTADAAAAGSVPQQVERAVSGAVTAGVARTTQVVTGAAATPSPTAARPRPSAVASAPPSPRPSPPPTSAAAAASPSPEAASPSPSPVDPSPSASPSPSIRHGSNG